jgi:hypothetical protein
VQDQYRELDAEALLIIANLDPTAVSPQAVDYDPDYLATCLHYINKDMGIL